MIKIYIYIYIYIYISFIIKFKDKYRIFLGVTSVQIDSYSSPDTADNKQLELQKSVSYCRCSN